jgi:transposase-like protein
VSYKDGKMHHRQKWSYEQRWEAVSHYLQTGSSIAVENATGIPAQTIRQWTQTEWWSNMLWECKQKHQKRVDAKIRGLQQTAFNKLADRLEKGDEHITPKGDKVYKEVPAAQLAQILKALGGQAELFKDRDTAPTKGSTIQDMQEFLESKGKVENG